MRDKGFLISLPLLPAANSGFDRSALECRALNSCELQQLQPCLGLGLAQMQLMSMRSLTTMRLVEERSIWLDITNNEK